MPETYKIIRFYAPDAGKEDRVIKRGLTRAEAMAHCRNPAKRQDGVFFDGFRLEQNEE